MFKVRILRLKLDTHPLNKELDRVLPHDPAQVCNSTLVAYKPITTFEMYVDYASDPFNLMDVPINCGLDCFRVKPSEPDSLTVVGPLA